ncbi:MAG: ABC transporter permease [Bryobacteraceae bacterium]|nr:ABC transporter permease [Bryobacteraceae bacterium]
MFDPARFYSWLLRFYPASFRERYQEAIELQFRDEYRETSTRRQRAWLWLCAVRDLMTSVPTEFARELTQDLKYSLRLYRKRSLSVVLAVSALALSIGASTGVFSVLNTLLLQALPFRNPEWLVELRGPQAVLGGRAAFREWRGQSSYLEDAATFSTSEMNLIVRGRAVRVRVAETSANFLELLGMRPAAGRTFTHGEEEPGHTGVAVISHRLWHQLFGGDPRVSGSPVELNGTPFTIVGVAPARFDYPDHTGVWVPAVFDYETKPKRGALFFRTIGRLKPGLTIGQARILYEAEVRRNAPEFLRAEEGSRSHLLSLREELSGPVRKAAWVLAGMILLVLLAACANVGHLLLSRVAERRQELAVRAALGASRARLVQQLTTEATVLTVVGAALGLVVAYWTSRLASSIAPPLLASQEYTVLDWRVIGFAAALALLTGFVFGVMPTLLTGRLQPVAQILRSRPGSPGRGGRRLRSALLAVQGCLTLALLATSLTMGRTFLQLLDTDLGFRSQNTVTLSVSVQGTKHRTSVAEWRYYSDVLERLRLLPGVEAAGAVSHLPLAQNAYMAFAFKLDSGQTVSPVVVNSATPDYFRAIGTRFLAGRDFRTADRRGSEPAVIVNEAFARAAKLGNGIVGRRISAPWGNKPYLIAGVVETIRFAGPAHPGAPMIYWPVEEEPPPHLTFVARVNGNARMYLARCRDVVRAVDPEVPVYDVKTLEQRLADMLARPRFFTTATLVLTLIAFLLAAAGIFGTAAHSVAQRSHEMGVRMALGASHIRLRALLLRESVAPVLAGAAAGIAVAVAGGRSLEHLVENARPVEIWTCAAAACLLVIAAAGAAWLATARLLAIRPADAVRAE